METKKDIKLGLLYKAAYQKNFSSLGRQQKKLKYTKTTNRLPYE